MRAAQHTSNFHAFAATLFDLFGGIEMDYSRGYEFTTLEIYVAGLPRPYLEVFKKAYGGRIEGDTWVVSGLEKGDEAEIFARSIKFFSVSRQEQLKLFRLARWSQMRELTEAEEARRIEIIKKLKACEEEFVLPRAFFKSVPARSTAKREKPRAKAKARTG